MATALLSTYITVCEHTLSVASAHNVMAPSVQKLQSDVRELVPSLEDSVAQIAAKLDAAYGTATPQSSAAPSSTSASVGAVSYSPGQEPASNSAVGGVMKLTQSPSLDDVKQRMGKLFHKPSTGNVQFWKKS